MNRKAQALLERLGVGPCWLEKGKAVYSKNPSSGDLIGGFYPTTLTQYEDVVEGALEAFKRWRTVPAPVRGQLVREVGEELRRVKDDLGALVSLEMGKILTEGRGEVQEMIDACDYAVGLSRQMSGSTLPSELPGHRLDVQWNPLGVVGVITAFNFPVAVFAWNAFVAAVCGDTVVWKPSSETPLCAIAMQKICNRVMRKYGHPDVFNLVIGKGHGQRIALDERIPLISFTGSCKTGREVATAVASRFGKSLLELGGNNAIIVMDDADLDLATRAIFFGAVGTAGQRCTTTRRVIMHEKIADELTGRLLKAYAQVKIGDPLDPDTLMGPLVNVQALVDHNDAVDVAVQQGGVILCGGKGLPAGLGDGSFVSPTIIKAHPEMAIVREETFTPILYLLTCKNLDEAIALNNDVPQGLSSAIFTRDIRNWEKFRGPEGSDCGIVNLNNGTSGAEIGGPFGGNKATGWGREMGGDAWKQYVRWSTCRVNYSDELPLAQGVTFTFG